MQPHPQITELEKLLYNKHLIVSRIQKNKPFRVKKDFTDIVNTDRHKFLIRLSGLFKKHPEINPDVFFKAPYALYPDVDYFSLEYFSTMRAVRAYTTYKKMIFMQDPDEQLPQIKESLKFIANFCIDHNIQLHQYVTLRNIDSCVWMTHYKQNKINPYSLFEFTDILTSTQSLADDVQQFLIGNFAEKFKSLYINYNSSITVKPYVKKAFPILGEFVRKQILNKTQLTNDRNKLM